MTEPHDGPRATYPWVERIAPVAERDHHLDNLEIAAILYRAWSSYLDAFAPSDATIRPTVRQITIRFDREVFASDQLECGVRCIGRSERAFSVEQTLWRSSAVEGRVVLAVGTTVLVAVDVATSVPTAIPASFWSHIERAEGRTIPKG
jgi:acyl-CoA thioesterase FadM